MEYDFYVFYLNSNLHDSYKNAVSEHLEMVKLSKKKFSGGSTPKPQTPAGGGGLTAPPKTPMLYRKNNVPLN